MEGKWDTSKRLSLAISDYMRESGFGRQMIEHRAISLWNTVLGPTVVRHTKNIYLNEGILYVELSSSVIRQELFMLKDRIIANLNAAVGQSVVKEIRFR